MEILFSEEHRTSCKMVARCPAKSELSQFVFSLEVMDGKVYLEYGL
jgi:hypothetical protein